MESSETNTKIDKQPEGQTSIGSFLWDLFKIIVLAFIITVPFRVLVAEPFVVSGSSMEPNFHDKNYLVVDRWTYSDLGLGSWKLKQGEAPNRGEAVVFKFPKNTKEYFIKRLIGLPGETISIISGQVVIYNKEHPDGFILKETYLKNQTETLGVLGKNGRLTLGEGEYFVLGDNRTQSSDSRVWGVLPKDDLVGRVFLRLWPIKQFGVVRGAEYNWQN